MRLEATKVEEGEGLKGETGGEGGSNYGGFFCILRGHGHGLVGTGRLVTAEAAEAAEAVNVCTYGFVSVNV
jgi:hypothetical protein